MYLKGSKWSMLHRRKPFNPFRVVLLLVLIGAAAYINFVVVPVTSPLFVPTPTMTRAPESYVKEAEEFYLAGKYTQAIDAYKKSIQSDPNNANNYVSLARVEVFAQKYKDAQTDAENALLLNNNNPLANAVRGWALMFQEDYLQAESSIKTAISLDPNSGLAHAYYAELLAKEIEAEKAPINAVDTAASESKLALALAPDLMETHRARGYVLQNTSNYAEAIQEFQTALQINNNVPDLHIALGLNYRIQEKYPEAVEEFTKAYALNPGDPAPNTYISRTYATIGDWTKAVQYGEQAVKDAPSDPYMYGNYGTMLYHNGQIQESVEPLGLSVRGGNNADGVAVKGLPLDYGRIAEYYFTYGLALAKMNQCTDAVQIAQLILQTVKDDETSVYNANAMIQICQANLIGTSTPEGTTTPGAEGTSVPVQQTETTPGADTTEVPTTESTPAQ
jgi:tetratricopeptide (TPR) repeat protein